MRQAEHQDKNNPGEIAAAPEFPGIPHKTEQLVSKTHTHRQHAQQAHAAQRGAGVRPHQPHPMRPSRTRTIKAVSRGPKYCEALPGKVGWGTGEQGSPQGCRAEVPLPGPHPVQGMRTPS